METKRDRQRPLLDQEFLKRSLAPVDIEERRRWEEIYIRYFQPTTPSTVAETVIEGSDNDDDFGCYWTKVGGNVVYYGGNVGVNINPQNENDFEVRGNILVEAIAETPYIEIRNWSDTEYDPMIHWSLGETSVKKFTMGVDDSDNNYWMLCAGGYLSKASAEEIYERVRSPLTSIIITESTNNRVHSILRSPFSSNIGFIGSAGSGDDQFAGPLSVCSDGTFFYVADTTNSRIVKRLVSDLSYVDQTSGAIPNVITSPNPIITDGTYLYVGSTKSGAYYIYKLRCSDLSYVDKFDRTNDWGNNGVMHMATDGTRIYVEASGGSTWRMCQVSCSTMNLLERFYDNDSEAELSGNDMTGAFVDGGIFYLIGGDPTHRYFYRFNASTMIFIDKSSNLHGAGDGQLTSSYEMDTDGTYIYVAEGQTILTNNRIQQFLLSDFSYVAKFGEYGIDEDEFGLPKGLCCVSIYRDDAYVPANHPIFVAEGVGSWVDSYPVHRFRDQIQLMEDEVVDATKYIGLNAPTAITASYNLTFPAAVPGAASHFSVSTDGTISWGQNIAAGASPSFLRITLTQATGTAPMTISSTTMVANLNADMVDGYHASEFTQLYIQATNSPTVDDDENDAPKAYREGCIWIEQDSNTVWFCADNTNGAAVWHGIDQDLTTGSTPTFVGADLGAVDIDGVNGYIKAGVPDTTRGIIHAYGSATGGNFGGSLFLYLADDYNAVISEYGLMIFEDDLYIGPDTNVDALILASTDDLYVTGGSIVLPASEYLNFGGTLGSGGYGVRDNAGTMEFCNNGGAWTAMGAGGGASAFTDLTDVDDDYTGDGGKFVKVNAGETGLEFVASSVAGHDILSASHDDAAASAVSRGSLICGNSTPAWAELVVGTAGQVLTTDGTDVMWGDPPAAAAHALLSATHNDTTAQSVSRGSLVYGDSTPKWNELTIGTAGYVLTSDGTDVAWALVPTHASRHQSGGADSIKLDDLAAPDDNTDLDVSTSLHGLCPKAPNDTSKYLRGDATWAAPAAGSDPWTVTKLTSEFSMNSNSPADVTGLAFTPGTSKYYHVIVFLLLRTSNAGIGVRVGSTWPTNLADGALSYMYGTTATAPSWAMIGDVSSEWYQSASGLPDTTYSYPAKMECVFITTGSTSGTFQVRVRSESNGTAIYVRAGSFIAYREI